MTEPFLKENPSVSAAGDPAPTEVPPKAAGTTAKPALFRWLRIKDHAIQGFALGVVAHGIGTARAFAINEQAGAFAALAMGLNGAITALLLPALLQNW